MVSYPLVAGTLGNVVCYCNEENGLGRPYSGPWVADVPEQEVIDHYKGWEPDLVHMLEVRGIIVGFMILELIHIMW